MCNLNFPNRRFDVRPRGLSPLIHELTGSYLPVFRVALQGQVSYHRLYHWITRAPYVSIPIRKYNLILRTLHGLSKRTGTNKRIRDFKRAFNWVDLVLYKGRMVHKSRRPRWWYPIDEMRWRDKKSIHLRRRLLQSLTGYSKGDMRYRSMTELPHLYGRRPVRPPKAGDLLSRRRPRVGSVV